MNSANQERNLQHEKFLADGDEPAQNESNRISKTLASEQQSESKIAEYDESPGLETFATLLFEIHKQNARELVPLLKAVSFREACSIQVSYQGIRVHVDDQHNQAAITYFKYDLFTEFNLRVPKVNMRIQLGPLLEALNFFSGNNAFLQLTCTNDGDPLVVVLEDEGVVARFTLNQQRLQPLLDFAFDEGAVIVKAIMKPRPLHDIVRDLDQSAEAVLIIVTPEYISFYVNGSLGRIKAEIKKHSEPLNMLQCTEERVAFYYRLTHIRRLLHSLSICDKVSLRIDARGVLSVQCIVILSEQQNSFIEHFILQENEIYNSE